MEKNGEDASSRIGRIHNPHLVEGEKIHRNGLITENGVLKTPPTIDGYACYLIVNGAKVTDYPFHVNKGDITSLVIMPAEHLQSSEQKVIEPC